MALSIGSVTVNADGTHTGSGLTLTIYENFLLPDLGFGIYPALKSHMIAARQTAGTRAQQLATAIINHLIANGEVTVTVAPADAGLQKTPNPNNADTATQGPGAPVVLATKGTIT